MLILLWMLVAALLLLGIFAGIEIAFMSVSKINIELRKKQGSVTGRILSKFIDKPDNFWAVMLISSCILLVIYTLLVIEINRHLLAQLPPVENGIYLIWGINLLAASALLLITSRLLPVSLFARRATSVLTLFAIPFILLYNLLLPLAKLTVSLSEFLLKYLFNVRIRENKPIFNRVAVEQFIKHSMHGHYADKREINAALFENALTLVNTKIRKCMIPRNEVIGVPAHVSMQEVKRVFEKTKLSKLIVYDKDIDHIRGYIHHLDLIKSPASVQDILHSIHAVPETMSAVDLLNKFTLDRKSIVWVIDEFGGTAGIVTMEDVLEEIFGDIKDEFDEEEYVEKQIAENEYIFSGRLELSYLKEKYNFIFYNQNKAGTLSGFIIDEYQSIPRIKDKIIIDRYEFDILLVTNTKIETVKMKVLH